MAELAETTTATDAVITTDKPDVLTCRARLILEMQQRKHAHRVTLLRQAAGIDDGVCKK
jgi:hypothetical protein